jgi:hypothetical protein
VQNIAVCVVHTTELACLVGYACQVLSSCEHPCCEVGSRAANRADSRVQHGQCAGGLAVAVLLRQRMFARRTTASARQVASSGLVVLLC